MAITIARFSRIIFRIGSTAVATLSPRCNSHGLVLALFSAFTFIQDPICYARGNKEIFFTGYLFDDFTYKPTFFEMRKYHQLLPVTK